MPKNCRFIFILIYLDLISISCSLKQETDPTDKLDDVSSVDGMKWIPGGDFRMGIDKKEIAHEGPAHPVSVTGFYIDETEVTNADFKKFVDATGHKTIAQIAPQWEDLKKQLPPDTPEPDMPFMAGSLVYIQPEHTVISLDDYSQWWRWVEGADWQHPEGPESSLDERWNNPVVHIAYQDAKAYCGWLNKRLPTEAEWEFASRGGEENNLYSWGNEFTVNGKFMANTFQGSFPNRNTLEDGFMKTSPVKSFPANAFGLYDMIGNVWEWTSDLYDVNYYKQVASKGKIENPKGSHVCYDPNEPYALKYVTRGGSFLCAENYCSNFRTTARQATAFDSGSSNIGFRCAKDRPQ